VFSLRYPATLRRDDTGGYYLRFPDVPGANTGDKDRDSTLAGAADCVAVALETYLEQGRDIPLPSKPKKGQYLVSVPLDLALRLALYRTMRETHTTAAELARRMKVREATIQEILNAHSATPPETYVLALARLGKTATLTVDEQPEHSAAAR
jgi:antitoxin HicB